MLQSKLWRSSIVAILVLSVFVPVPQTSVTAEKLIDGLLKTPDSPPPLQFNPNSIKDIAAVSPTSGVNLVKPPLANNQGSADLTYPIDLPAGRGAYSPRLALSYSSARGNGWLGMGWDLPTAKIEVDTRWGVPNYKGGERYLLNGAALVPVTQDTSATCKVGSNIEKIEQFAPRIDTFERIVRCTSDKATHWEVTAKDGTRYEYGTDAESRLTSYSADEKNHIAIWYLRRIVDPNDNATEYLYGSDAISATSEVLEPSIQIYPEVISYTSHITNPVLPATYRVEFQRECSNRSDPIVSGRFGFKIATRCRLDQVFVYLVTPAAGKTLIRRYSLEYQLGSFGKSLLKRVVTFGSDGNSKFYDHTFEYTQPEFQAHNTGSNQPFASTAQWQAAVGAEQPPDKYLLGFGRDRSHNATQGGAYGYDDCSFGGSTSGSLDDPRLVARHGDMSGDGIADRFWTFDAQVLALTPTLANTTVFNNYPVQGLDQIGTEQSLGLSQNFGVNCSSGNLGVTFALRKSTTLSTLADQNGDGYADLASEGGFLPHLPSHCRDGKSPGVTGLCSDGLPACDPSTPICFAGFERVGDTLTEKSAARISDSQFLLADASEPSANLLVAMQASDPISLTAATPWGRTLAFGTRIAEEPKLAAQQYPLDPVIRWDALHDGEISLTVIARRKFLGGADGVKLSLLKVTDSSTHTGTSLLGTLILSPTTADWQTFPNIAGRKFPVHFGESILVVVDTIKDLPVARDGRLIDEIETSIHIQYNKVCPIEQPCHDITDKELEHRDATGQLAYVFKFPEDFRVSELPRLDYWQLVPPFGPARLRSDGGFDQNGIASVVSKTKVTNTPVHIRIRCESADSQLAHDGTICPVGTILNEHIFAPDEIGQHVLTATLPNPFRPQYRIAGTLKNTGGQNRAFFGTPFMGNEFQLVELGTLGGSNSYAYALNDDGSIVGASETADGYFIHAFLWTQERGMIDLTPDLCGNSWALSINNKSQIVGYLKWEKNYQSVPPDSRWAKCITQFAAGTAQLGKDEAFLWGDGKLTMLSSANTDGSRAVDINDRGQIVGKMGIDDNHQRSALWTLGLSGNYQVKDLLTGISDNAEATAINNLGQVVGMRTTISATLEAFLWSPPELSGPSTDPLIFLIPPAGLTNAQAKDLNDRGYVVGIAQTLNEASSVHLTAWKTTSTSIEALDLGDAVVSDIRVNIHGDIVGQARGQAQLWPFNGSISVIGKDVSNLAINGTFSYEPERILMEVDGENGLEVPPDAIEWHPTMKIVSVYDVQEAKRPNPNHFRIIGYAGEGTQNQSYIWSNQNDITHLGPEQLGIVEVKGMNRFGQIIGSSNSTGQHHAFVWTPTSPNADPASGQFYDLGTLGTLYSASEATDINDQSQIVGFSINESEILARHLVRKKNENFVPDILRELPQKVDDQTRIFELKNTVKLSDGQFFKAETLRQLFVSDNQPIQHLESVDVSSEYQLVVKFEKDYSPSSDQDFLDTLSQIVVSTQADDGVPHAFVWHRSVIDITGNNSHMMDLGTLGGSGSRAFGINNRGQIVGESITSTGWSHAFLWTPGFDGGVLSNTRMLDLGTLGGAESRAFAINNQGQVVGESEIVDGQIHAFIWTPDPLNSLSSTPPLQDLGSFCDGESHAYDINDEGVIVGNCIVNGISHAVLWETLGTVGIRMRDLHSDKWDPREIQSSQAMHITAQGDVVGFVVTLEGQKIATHWSPGNDPQLLTSPLGTDNSWAIDATSGVSVDFPRLKPGKFVNPETPWEQPLPVLYRVHPNRQLIPLRATRDNQTLEVTASIYKSQHPLIVTVIGDDVEGELTRTIVTTAGEVTVRRIVRNVNKVFKPDLAQKLPFSTGDDRTWQINLHPSIKLDNGQLITAQTIVQILKGGNHSIEHFLDAWVETEYSLFIKLDDVNPNFLDQLSKIELRTQAVSATRRFHVQLPKPGLYYVRGYAEATFDTQTNMHLSAVMLESPQSALINKARAQQLGIGEVNQYSDLDRSEAIIEVVTGTLGYLAAVQTFPRAKVYARNTIDEALNDLRLNEAVAVVGDIETLAPIADNDFYLCCAPGLPRPIIPTLPTNLLLANFGGGYDLGRPISVTLPGEVWYSFETYGGGHHGFFFGQFNGNKDLVCVGKFPCKSPDNSVESMDKDVNKIQIEVKATGPITGNSHFTPRIGGPKVLAARAMQTALNGYLVLVSKRTTGEPDPQTYSDLNQPNISILIPADNDATQAAQFLFGQAKIEQIPEGVDILTIIQTQLASGNEFSLLFNANDLSRMVSEIPNLLDYTYLCCTPDSPIHIYSCKSNASDCLHPDCYFDNDGNGVVNCYEPNCELDSDGDGINDCKEARCLLDTDGDGIPDCTDPDCKEDCGDPECVLNASKCGDPECAVDSNADGIPDCITDNPTTPVPINDDPDLDGIHGSEDLCPYAPEDFDDDRDWDGCPDGPQSHPRAPRHPVVVDDENGNSRGGPLNPPAPNSGVSDRSGTDGPCFSNVDRSLRVCAGGSVHPSVNLAVSVDPLDLERTWTFGVDAHIGGSVSFKSEYVSVGLGATASFGEGVAYTDLGLMDWNGDGIADLVEPDTVTLNGRRESFSLGIECFIAVPNIPKMCNGPGVRERLNVSGAFNLSAGTSAIEVKTDPKGKVREQGASSTDTSFGLNAFLSQSAAVFDRMDVNGDGLPDQVAMRGSVTTTLPPGPPVLIVRLNLGYRLGEPEIWGKFTDDVDIGNQGGSTFTSGSGPLADVAHSTLGQFYPSRYSLSTSENFSLGITDGYGYSYYSGGYGGGGKFGCSENTTLVQTRRQMADINGDGLLDLVLKNPASNRMFVSFNQGGPSSSGNIHAFSAPVTFTIPSWIAKPRITQFDRVPATQVFGELIGSVTDFLCNLNSANSGRLIAALGDITQSEFDTLSLSGSQSQSWSGEVAVRVWGIHGITSYAFSQGSNSSQLGLYDVNGDGMPDRVMRRGDEGNAAIQLQENLFGGANLLSVVHNPLGGRILLDYIKQIPTEDNPNTRWLLQSTTIDNEPTFPTAFKTMPITQTFEYIAPYYDRWEREFSGFSTVRTVRADGRIVETVYENRDYWKKGLTKQSRTIGGDGRLYTQTDYTYDPVITHKADPEGSGSECLAKLVLPLADLNNSVLQKAGKTPCDSWFIRLTTEIISVFEGQVTPKVTILRYEEYDAWGNVNRITDEQDTGIDDDLVALITYAHANTDPNDLVAKHLVTEHIVDRVRSVDVRQGNPTGDQLRLRKAEYDTHGNLLYHEVYADSAGKLINKLDLETDTLGFVKATSDTTGYRVEYVPDPLTHRVAITTTDNFSLTATTTYDFRFQLPTSQIDANGQKMVNGYDIFGRLTQVQSPYELAAGLTSLSVTYSDPEAWNTSPVYATTSNLAVVPGSSEVSTEIKTTIFVDGFGRAIQTQTDAEVNGVVGRVASGRIEFDALGRKVRLGQPAFVPTSAVAIMNTAFTPGRFTEWVYDALDRTTVVTDTGNRVTRMDYDLGQHPRDAELTTLRTKITDPEGKTHFEHRDAMSQLVAVVQVADGKDLITSYAYQPTGELASIEDARNNRSQFEYDLAGHRISVMTPDTGRLELGYDAAGNLSVKTDAVLCPLPGPNLLTQCNNQQKIRYQYDKGRLKSTLYPHLSATQFVYGDEAISTSQCPNTTNARGRICNVIDASGAEKRNYGALGETVRTDRLMHGAVWETTDRTFTTSYVFDSFGRMLSLIYPDGEMLTYGYDAGGQVNHVEGLENGQTSPYVKDIVYDEFGQRTRLEYGNGVVITQTYETDTRRLDTQTIMSLGQSNPLRQLDYDYDRASNIRTITDSRMNLAPFLQSANRSYTYDDLHRLKTSNVVAVESGTLSKITDITSNYDYDSVGNITSQDITRQQEATTLAAYPSRAWTYTYSNPARPNLPDKIGPYSFTYDARGSILASIRQVGSDAPLGTTYTWDDEGRLITSQRQGSGSTTLYIYGHDGQRARKQTPAAPTNAANPSDTTVYPNEFYTARFARTVTSTCATPPCWEQSISRSKHIYIGKERIAVSAAVINPATANDSETKLVIAAKLKQYFQSDQVGSTALTTNEQGKAAQQVDYLPFGEVLFDQLAPSSSRLPQALRFNGKELDLETGLQYFGARYYDARFGRFISPDSIIPDVTNPSNLNRYGFAHNNPISRIDPNGHWVWLVPILIGMALTWKSDEDANIGVVLPPAATATLQSVQLLGALYERQQLLNQGNTGPESEAKLKAYDTEVPELIVGIGLSAAAAGLSKGATPVEKNVGIRPGREQPVGGNGVVLRDAQGATPAEVAASSGGPLGGVRGRAQAQARMRELKAAEDAWARAGKSGPVEYPCWRCGKTSTDPADMHLAHKNVPASRGGNLEPVNTCLEGQACNLSAGNRGAPSPGMSCAERGSCGIPKD